MKTPSVEVGVEGDGRAGDADGNEAEDGQQGDADHQAWAAQHEAPGEGDAILLEPHPHGASSGI